MKKTAFACASLLLALAAAPALARDADTPSVRIRDVSSGKHLTQVAVTVTNRGRAPLAVSGSDFAVSAEGDIFRARARRLKVGPRRSGRLQLTVSLPAPARRRAALYFRPSHARIPLGRPARRALTSAATARTFWATAGVGYPWGTAVDGAGNVWFAEPGCDFAPTCSSNTRPGQIGELKASSRGIVFYTLPNIPGNQPIFLAFDGSGNLWFTTPNNSMIGEFNPASGRFIGQWPVTPGSGPWGLTFAGDTLWYTEHLASAVGSFDPSTHAYRDFQTPTPKSNPYGIAASGGLIWFTENNSGVDRVASLDTSGGNAISEYPIVQPLSGTPHLIAIDAGGHPWWTEGWSNTIATLDPGVATPGQCGTASGTCRGVQRFKVPPPGTCSTSGTHTSGIAIQRTPGVVWFDNSLTAQVGSFDPAGGTFAVNSLSNCSAHPHDGLSLDAAGNVWFDEEFVNAIGELVAPAPPQPAPGVTISGFTPASGPAGATVTITGANFTGATAVAFSGTAATFTVDSANQITATVPNGAASGPITVTTPAATATSSGSFTVVAPPSAVVAADSFNRTVSGGWGTADAGGQWTLLDTPANWSVAPGAGSVSVAPTAQARAVLGDVQAQDVDLLANIALPLCGGGANCDAFLLGRYTGGGSPTYYRVGVVQGQRSTVYIRAQRDDGSFLSSDLDTGIPAAPGVLLSMRVQFLGVNPTTIRARIWPAGTAEPSTWQLSASDSTPAEQVAGAVGVRVRNEDSSAPRTFQFQGFQASR